MHDNPLRNGDSFHCDVCDTDSLVKVERKMDGWTVVGEVFTCAFCHAELPGLLTVPDASPAAASKDDDEKIDRLSALLAEDRQERIRLEGEIADFCRDCRHYFKNAFQSHCMFHDRDVEPMSDCSDFERRPEE